MPNSLKTARHAGRARDRFAARLARGGVSARPERLSAIVQQLVAAADRPGLLAAARAVAVELAGGCPPGPVDLILEATAAARGLPSWDALAAALPRYRSQEHLLFPVLCHCNESEEPLVAELFRELGLTSSSRWFSPHEHSWEGTWLDCAMRLTPYHGTKADPKRDQAVDAAWRRVHPGGKNGFMDMVAALVSRGCTLHGSRAIGSRWMLCEWSPAIVRGPDDYPWNEKTGKPVNWLEIPHGLVWDMAEAKKIHIPHRARGGQDWLFEARVPPGPDVWRGTRLIGEPQNRLDAIIWLRARGAHAIDDANDETAGSKRGLARFNAYAERLRHVLASAPCPVCDGGEEQVLMDKVCEDCGGSGYAYDA